MATHECQSSIKIQLSVRFNDSSAIWPDLSSDCGQRATREPAASLCSGAEQSSDGSPCYGEPLLALLQQPTAARASLHQAPHPLLCLRHSKCPHRAAYSQLTSHCLVSFHFWCVGFHKGEGLVCAVMGSNKERGLCRPRWRPPHCCFTTE